MHPRVFEISLAWNFVAEAQYATIEGSFHDSQLRLNAVS